MPARAREVLRAQRLLVKLQGGVTFREITGRSPSTWDVGALDALATEEGRAYRSDQAIREREMKDRQK